MRYKASLHIHAREDKGEKYNIKYNVYQLIDKAKYFDFKILAFTFHDNLFIDKKCFDYAKSKGILLIPGIEKSIFDKERNKTHVIILNPDKKVEEIKSWEDLFKYKKNKSNIFVMLAHPFFPFINIKEKVFKKNVDVFDAIEHSWAYSKKINFNRKAERLANEYNKPFIATADLHNLRHLNHDYTIIEPKELTIESVFSELKKGRIENISKTKTCFDVFYTMFTSRI